MYRALLSNDEVIPIPMDARNDLESIRNYGLRALLERAARAPRLVKLRKKEHIFVKAIIAPNGQHITTEEIGMHNSTGTHPVLKHRKPVPLDQI